MDTVSFPGKKRSRKLGQSHLGPNKWVLHLGHHLLYLQCNIFWKKEFLESERDYLSFANIELLQIYRPESDTEFRFFLQLLRHENFFVVFLWLQLSFSANYRENTWLVTEAQLIQRYKSCSWVENTFGIYLVKPVASEIRLSLTKCLGTIQWGAINTNGGYWSRMIS